MVVTCEHCGARYRLDPGRIQGRGARITCPRCRHVFIVYQDGAGAEVRTEAVVEERPTDVHSLDFKSVGISTWKVKTGIGLVYDFSDYNTLRKYLKEGRVSTSDTLSHDGEQWNTIGEISDLESHFIDAYVAARSSAQQSAEAEVDAGAAPVDSVDAEAVASDLLENLTPADDSAAEEAEGVEIDEADDGPQPVAPESEGSADDIADQLLAAVEAAASEDDAGIELDMDSLLEQASASVESEKTPASARRGAEQKAVQSVAKTGKDDDNPHQFVDPFEALKASRQQRNTTRGQRKSKKAVAAEVEAKTKQKQQLILVGLFACAAAAYFGIDQTPDTGPSPQQVQSEKKKREKEAQDAEIKKLSEEARARMQENLNKALKDVKVEEIDAFTVEEAQLIVKVPEQFQKGAASGMPVPPTADYGAVPDASGSGAAAGVTQRSMSADDHFALGESAIRAKKWSSAVTAFKSALAENPENARFRTRYGYALYKSGDLGEAEVQLRKSVSAGALSAHKYLGHMAREQGDISGASNHYQAYLRASPPDAKAIEIMMSQMTQ